jgi:alpha-tubulin suppressor-like RCC1 family protein
LGVSPVDSNPHPNPRGISNLGFSSTLSLAAGLKNSCAIAGDGTGNLRCWGDNRGATLGDGNKGNTGFPPTFVCVGGNTCQTNAAARASGVAQVAVGWDHACALINGAVKCWGQNQQGQLGDGSQTEQRSIVTTAIPEKAKAIACGNQHTCALLETGAVRCWGANTNGQLGNDDALLVNRPAPTAVAE